MTRSAQRRFEGKTAREPFLDRHHARRLRGGVSEEETARGTRARRAREETRAEGATRVPGRGETRIAAATDVGMAMAGVARRLYLWKRDETSWGRQLDEGRRQENRESAEELQKIQTK